MPSLVTPNPFVFVVDPEEERRTTNTGWMAKSALSGQWNVGPLKQAPAQAMVLFPGAARRLSPADRGRPIVVIDSTWRRAKAHARRDPLIQLTHVSLPQLDTGLYPLRDGHKEGRLCTLEAVAYALFALGADAEGSALLSLLDGFVTRTLALRAGTATNVCLSGPKQKGERR